ncbi:MAG: site-specific integrase [Oscillospiraceae bacterium]|nr:site-specific integrase [Oscillospiraceae bacterium]
MAKKKEKKTNRAAQGEGSIRQRPDGRWEARFTIGRDPGTGKQIQKSVYGATEKDVVAKKRQALAAVDAGTFKEPSRVTVGQWMDVWIADYLGGVKPGTVANYKTQVHHNINPAIGAVRLQKLMPHQIQSFYNDLLRNRGLSPKTIKNLHGVLHKSLKQAVALGYIQQNPSDNVVLPRVERKEMHVLESGELPAFLAAISESNLGNLFYVALFTGMRRGEVCGLSWDCVDFEKGLLLIKKQLVRSRRPEGPGFVLATTKNDKTRLITPAPSVMERLRAEQKRQAENKQKASSLWIGNPDNLVFTNAFGRYLLPDYVYKKYKRIVTELGLGELRLHDLRHTYAVNSLQGGDDIKTVQDNLGHYTAAFTLDVYGHVSEQMKRDSADRMERLIKQAQQAASSDP